MPMICLESLEFLSNQISARNALIAFDHNNWDFGFEGRANQNLDNNFFEILRKHPLNIKNGDQTGPKNNLKILEDYIFVSTAFWNKESSGLIQVSFYLVHYCCYLVIIVILVVLSISSSSYCISVWARCLSEIHPIQLPTLVLNTTHDICTIW